MTTADLQLGPLLAEACDRWAREHRLAIDPLAKCWRDPEQLLLMAKATAWQPGRPRWCWITLSDRLAWAEGSASFIRVTVAQSWTDNSPGSVSGTFPSLEEALTFALPYCRRLP